MLDREEIPCLVCDEFVEVDQAVEKDTNLLVIFLKFLKRKVSLLLRLDHVVHLAQ